MKTKSKIMLLGKPKKKIFLIQFNVKKDGRKYEILLSRIYRMKQDGEKGKKIDAKFGEYILQFIVILLGETQTKKLFSLYENDYETLLCDLSSELAKKKIPFALKKR